jgi:hypothetical protein
VVDFRELQNFFGARGIDPVCPICAAREWGYVGTEEGDQVFPLRRKDGSMGQGIDVFLIICRQCGFVSAHAYDAITGRAELAQE